MDGLLLMSPSHLLLKSWIMDCTKLQSILKVTTVLNSTEHRRSSSLVSLQPSLFGHIMILQTRVRNQSMDVNGTLSLTSKHPMMKQMTDGV